VIVHLAPPTPRVERPGFVWLAVALELFTGVLAIPVRRCRRRCS